ncbi:MAG: hypothetical protein U0163_15965 [Gemmatimonadaceae bacterium]
MTKSTIRAPKLRDQYDLVLVPDMSLRDFRAGMPASVVLPQFAGGLGDEGLAVLKKHVEPGRTFVLLGRVSEIGNVSPPCASRAR